MSPCAFLSATLWDRTKSAALKVRKLLILLNEKNVKNTEFAEQEQLCGAELGKGIVTAQLVTVNKKGA